MLTFFCSNWDWIIFAVLLAAAASALYIRGEKATLPAMLFRVVTELERTYGSGTGMLKKAAAIEFVYGKLPGVIGALLPTSFVDEWIETALVRAKRYWSENAKLLAAPKED